MDDFEAAKDMLTRIQSVDPQPPAIDVLEATKVVLSRIQRFDPQKAFKIMGYALTQEQAENEIKTLAFVSDSHLLLWINHTKFRMGLHSNPISPNLVANNGFYQNNPSPRAAAIPIGRPSPISCAALPHGNSGLAPTNLNFNGGNINPMGFPYGEEVIDVPSPYNPITQRSYPLNDAAFLGNGEEGRGFGGKPCRYFASSGCRNGDACRFLHDAKNSQLGSPRLDNSGFNSPVPYRKNPNFSNENQSFDSTISKRQIYLTFPAESTFKEEDVASYFSNNFGPVQDVRIPHQTQRMFGFVTFQYPETVKRVLTQGNPHFVCDSRVLVKPYKDKKQLNQQHYEKGECSSRINDLDSLRMIHLERFINLHLEKPQPMSTQNVFPDPISQEIMQLGHANGGDSFFSERLEHILPANLLGSPTRSAMENQSDSNKSPQQD